MRSGQFIQDTMPFKITRSESIMVEYANGRKSPVLRIGGQFQRAGLPNANGRIYPKHVLKEAVDSIQEDIKNRKVLGEFDHPPDAKIHLDRVSHLITKLYMEGDVVYGECEILENTTYGRQLKALHEHGIDIGISSRGVGDMESVMFEGEEYYQVMEGFSFVTWDVVAQPSVHNSYLYVVEDKKTPTLAQPKLPQSRSQIIPSRINHRKLNEEATIEEMRKFFKDLRRK